MAEWRTIPSAALYAASSDGQIKRTAGGRGTAKTTLKQQSNNMGYPMVQIYYGRGMAKRRLVSRLVCEAFNGPPPPGKDQCAHNDGNPKNNSANNLRWASRRENEADKAHHGTLLRGEAAPWSKLDWATVRAMRSEYTGSWGEASKIAAKFGLTMSRTHQILRGTIWAEPEYTPPPAPRSHRLKKKAVEAYYPGVKIVEVK